MLHAQLDATWQSCHWGPRNESTGQCCTFTQARKWGRGEGKSQNQSCITQHGQFVIAARSTTWVTEVEFIPLKFRPLKCRILCLATQIPLLLQSVIHLTSLRHYCRLNHILVLPISLHWQWRELTVTSSSKGRHLNSTCQNKSKGIPLWVLSFPPNWRA